MENRTTAPEVLEAARNVLKDVLTNKAEEVGRMLRAIYSQESRESALEKAASVVSRLKEMKLQRAAKTLEQGIGETLSYYDFRAVHWRKIRTNNALERLNREIRSGGEATWSEAFRTAKRH